MNIIKNVIVYPICGFANRLRFISTCYSICKKNNWNMQIYWETSEECNIEFDSIFESIDNIEWIKNLPNNYTCFGHIHLRDVFEKITNLLNQNNTKDEFAIDNLIVVGGHEYIHPDLTNLEFLKLKHEIYNKIKWNKNILKKVDEITQHNNLNDYISVHYRSIDKKFDANDLKNSDIINFDINSSINDFNKYTEMVKKNLKLILFSNKKNINIKNCTRLMDSDCDRENTDDMINSIVEFVIMSRSKLIIGSYFSSFSDEACFFNLIPKIIPTKISNINNYHCNFISNENNIVSLNYNSKILIDSINF